LVFFEDDAATGSLDDFELHPFEFFFEKISEGDEGVLSEEEEALGDAGLAEFSADEEAPKTTAVFMNEICEGAVFLFFAFDTDEHGDGLGAVFDFALDDDFSTAAFCFVKADPDAFYDPGV